MAAELKLNLGCGPRPLDGYVNIDFFDTDKADLVHDLRRPLPYEDGTVDEIYSCDVIEHFSYAEWPHVKSDWARVLKVDGVLRLVYPDFDALVDGYLHDEPKRYWLGLFYGGQTSEGDFHKNAFTTERVIKEFTELGFGEFSVDAHTPEQPELRCVKVRNV